MALYKCSNKCAPNSESSKSHIRHQKETKTGKQIDVDKELFDYMTKWKEDSLNQSKEIGELILALERVTFHSH